MARLPQPGGDSGNWGDILNDYLSTSLKADGSLKDDTVGTSQLKDNSVTAAQLAPSSVTSASMASNAVTKADVGLGSVDNTSDVNKPVSTAQLAALDTKLAIANLDSETATRIGDSGSATAVALGAAIEGQIASDEGLARAETKEWLPQGGKKFIFSVSDRGVDGHTRLRYGVFEDGSTYPAMQVDTLASPSAVVIWGDSLVENWNTSLLATDLDLPVSNKGRGGQSSARIIARQGGDPVRVTFPSNYIPASGSVIVTMGLQVLGGAINTGTLMGTICGVSGTISVDSSGIYTWTRTTAGSEVAAPPASVFIVGTEFRDHAPIFCVGRNDYSVADAATLIPARLRRALDWTHRPEAALILSFPPSADGTEDTGDALRTTLDAVNEAIKTAFPSQWVDVAAYLRNTRTLASVGITPTAQDNTDIGNGVTPLSFRSDALHYNANAYLAINQLIVREYAARGVVTA